MSLCQQQEPECQGSKETLRGPHPPLLGRGPCLPRPPRPGSEGGLGKWQSMGRRHVCLWGHCLLEPRHTRVPRCSPRRLIRPPPAARSHLQLDSNGVKLSETKTSASPLAPPHCECSGPTVSPIAGAPVVWSLPAGDVRTVAPEASAAPGSSRNHVRPNGLRGPRCVCPAFPEVPSRLAARHVQGHCSGSQPCAGRQGCQRHLKTGFEAPARWHSG